MNNSPTSTVIASDDARHRLEEPAALISRHISLIREAGVALSETVVSDIGALDIASERLQMQVEVFVSVPADDPDIDLSTLRHDMRNTLGALIGYTEMLSEDNAFESGSQADQSLQAVWRETRNLVSVLESLANQQGARGNNADVIDNIFRGDAAVGEKPEAVRGVILVADDDASNRGFLVAQLKRDGHAVYEAANGAEALQLVDEVVPEVILLDLIMPDMSGYEVLQKLRGGGRIGSARVVMISGMSDEASAVRCIEGGAADFLTKPVNSTLLRARVGAMLERVAWDRKEKAYTAELQKSRDFIRGVFGRYLSDEIVQNLLDKPDGLDLGGSTRRVTILMSDIRGFSQISRELPPPELLALLNNYLGPMTEIIMDFGGTVDEFVGDSILAIFGAPLEKDDDCDRALACALAMQNAMREINSKNAGSGLPEIAMGIGVNTGDVVVGNIGSERRSKYGIVGHHVNLTSRIESCTVGGQILISDTCRQSCAAPLTIKNSMTVSFKGARTPLPLHDLTAIGGDFDLQLTDQDEDMQQPGNTLNDDVEIRLLQTKMGEGEIIKASIAEFGTRTLNLKVEKSLPALADISMTFSQQDERGNAYVLYAKVTGAQDTLSPLLTVTSTPVPLRQLLGGNNA